MIALLSYIIKVTSILALVWLFYSIALKRHTFYTANRWYFLAGVLSAFVLPFLSFPQFAATNPVIRRTAEQFCELDVSHLVFMLSQPQTAQTVMSATDLIVWVIGGGMVLFLFHFCCKLASFFRLRRRASEQLFENTKIWILTEKTNPFSFWGHIFINPALHTEAEMAEIIAHEIFHIKQKHTLDLVFTELLVVVFWFNPFAWLLRKAVRQNLEYLADRHVLNSGFDIMQYQYILVRTSIAGTPGLSIAHNFTFSNLKKRIVMMNKKPSSRMAMLKCLLLIPLFTFAWVGTHARNITQRLNDIVLIQQEAPIEQVETIAPKIQDSIKVVGVRSQPKKEVIKYVDTLKINAEAQMEMAIRQQEIARLQNEIAKMQKEVAEKQREMEAIQFGEITMFKNRVIAKDSGFVALIQDSVIRIRSNSPLLILDGEPIATIDAIDPNMIESITVLKTQNAVDLYGKKAKDGVVLITTKQKK